MINLQFCKDVTMVPHLQRRSRASRYKLIHVSAVIVSFFGFAARGLGALRDASWVRHPLARTLPHMLDTVLLLSALGMLYILRLPPWEQPWLRAKIIGLCCCDQEPVGPSDLDPAGVRRRCLLVARLLLCMHPSGAADVL